MSETTGAAPEEAPDDFSDIQPKVSDSASQRVRELAIEMKRREVAIKAAETTLKNAKTEYAEMRDDVLPAAIIGYGVRGFDIDGIGYVTYKDDVKGGLPSKDERPEDRARALAWFDPNGHGQLIKRKLVAEMPREMPATVSVRQISDVVSMLAELSEPDRGEGAFTLNDVVERIIEVLVPGTKVSTDLDIHPQTLAAWARELIEEGKDIDFKPLGLVPIKRATISVSKAKNRRKAKEL